MCVPIIRQFNAEPQKVMIVSQGTAHKLGDFFRQTIIVGQLYGGRENFEWTSVFPWFCARIAAWHSAWYKIDQKMKLSKIISVTIYSLFICICIATVLEVQVFNQSFYIPFMSMRWILRPYLLDFRWQSDSFLRKSGPDYLG